MRKNIEQLRNPCIGIDNLLANGCLMRISIAVTNDLSYDQRMIRICHSLVAAGHEVTWVGRLRPDSIPVDHTPYRQVRLRGLFEKGPGFYLEHNLRVFFYLLSRDTDLFWAVDLDMAPAIWLASACRRKPRLMDAHELFCEMRELKDRHFSRFVWRCIERLMIPRFPTGCTVSEPIARHYQAIYGVRYVVVRNLPVRYALEEGSSAEPFILYQGAVNEGRCFEQLIPAMAHVEMPLHIYGKGNFLRQAKELVQKYGVADKVFFKGILPPAALQRVTIQAYVGISLFEKGVLQNEWSLANRFFDFIQAGVPQLCSDFPEYRKVVEKYPVASLLDDHCPMAIAKALNKMIQNQVLHMSMHDACRKAAMVFHWQGEEKALLEMLDNLS